MDDSTIIQLYNNRNECAITQSASKYGDYLHKIAYNILMDEEDSKECVNDTWLRTWNSIPPQQPKNLKLFLSKIVRNLSLDKYREKHRGKRGRGEIEIALDEIDEIVSTTVEVDDEVAAHELQELIRSFVRKLPARECDIFMRRYFFIDSISDIADRYGMSEGHVRMSLSRTRKKLKDRIASEGFEI